MASSPSSVLMLGFAPQSAGLIITLGFGTGGTPPTPPPVVATTPSGVRRSGKRRWALKYYDKIYYFDDLQKLEAFANQPPKEAMRPELPKRKAKPQIIVPVETIREAKAAGYEGLQKLADRLDYAALKTVEARAFSDREDFDDFMEFLRALDG